MIKTTPFIVLEPVRMFSAEKSEMSNHEIGASACTAIQVAMQEPLIRSTLITDVGWRINRCGLHRSMLTVSFRPKGRFLKRSIRCIVDGRQPSKVRINGRIVDIHMAAHEATLLVESVGNRA